MAAAAAAGASPDAEPNTEPQEQPALSQSDAALISAAGCGETAELRRLLAEGADAAAQVARCCRWLPRWRSFHSFPNTCSTLSQRCSKGPAAWLGRLCGMDPMPQSPFKCAYLYSITSCASFCRKQDDETGQSVLMAAAAAGATEAVEALLEAGAPWNAIDRRGRCAGDFAMDGDHADAAGAILEAGDSPPAASSMELQEWRATRPPAGRGTLRCAKAPTGPGGNSGSR